MIAPLLLLYINLLIPFVWDDAHIVPPGFFKANRVDADYSSVAIRFTKGQRMIYRLFRTAYSTRVKANDSAKFFGVQPS